MNGFAGWRGIGAASLVTIALAAWAAAAPARQGAKPVAPRPGSTAASEPVDVAFFEKRVRPILAARCLGCHGVDTQLAHLDLRSRISAIKGGGRGAAIVAGDAKKSLLVHLINGDRAPLMPPDGKLPAAERAILTRWIDGGAPYSAAAPIATAAKQIWWSFRPLDPAASDRALARLLEIGSREQEAGSKPTPSPNLQSRSDITRPKGRPGYPAPAEERGHSDAHFNGWTGGTPPRRPFQRVDRAQRPTPNTQHPTPNPIDVFVGAQLRETGLSFAPAASRRVLIRRVYADVIGLPPSPEDVEAFVRDPDPDAYTKLVDRLLASPRYGERWGRHWLDLARYADSGGFEGDKDRPLMWRYRDWVIRAFNDDLSYDRFLTLQLAGDETPGAGNDGLIATGYLWAGPQDIVENNARTRSNELDDLVATTGSVMLGLTVGCARCHDHKYDPVTTVDYYRLAAVFAPTERREVEVPTTEERRAADAKNALLDAEQKPIAAEGASLRQKGEAAAKAAGVATPSDDQIIAALPDADRARARELFGKFAAIAAQRPSLPHASAVTDKARTFPVSHVLTRGDAYHLGAEVKPGFVCALPGGAVDLGDAPANASTTLRRSALAAWMTGPQNPLTARVWMNRVWRQRFGHGLVDTPSNFGLSGELPSHPELLDWLAVQFVRGGWRLKPMHRLMLLSRTYQQSSAMRPDAAKIDPQNRLLARMPLRRLEAEAIRDSLLSVAGTLNLTEGGPPVYPPVDPSLRADTFQGMNWPIGEDNPSTWRRSVYVKVKRSLLLPQLEVFDCPEITYTVEKRNVTTTPLQALMLLNDPLIRRQGGLFAARLERDRPHDTWAQVDRAYRLAFGRPPSARERQLSLEYLKTRSLPDFCQAIFNLNEFVYVP